MITVTQSRVKDRQHYEQPTLTFNDPLEALVHLAKVELGWGGQIIDIDKSRIKVETNVLYCLDTSVFEGPSEEMKPLLELAYFYTEAVEKHDDLIRGQVVDHTVRLPDGIGGVPLFLSMVAPLLMGNHRLKVAVMLACGLHDENDLKSGLDARIEDLVAAVQLSRDGHCSFQETLAL